MSRGIFGEMFQNFLKTLRRPPPTVPVGEDHLGNKYFQSDKSAASGRRAKRWFEPYNEDKFDQEVPVEWEAWLRYRRHVPPTLEEILNNEAMKKSVQEKVKELEKRQQLEGSITAHGKEDANAFPELPGYQKVPGGGFIREPDAKPTDKKDNK